MKPTTAIRLMLTIGLMVGVYLETGIFTTVFAGLMFLYTEAAAFIARKKGLYK
jgi:hypothetical protein